MNFRRLLFYIMSISSTSSISSEEVTLDVDYEALKEDILGILDDPSHDDGSIAPILLRLAWHSSGTYDEESGSGGSNGAGMRFEESSEALDPDS